MYVCMYVLTLKLLRQYVVIANEITITTARARSIDININITIIMISEVHCIHTYMPGGLIFVSMEDERWVDGWK